jgi:hypothetical protein
MLTKKFKKTRHASKKMLLNVIDVLVLAHSREVTT